MTEDEQLRGARGRFAVSSLPISERFMRKVNVTESCWLWTGGTNGRGYGRLWVNGKSVLAHRLSCALFASPIPDDKEACHQCDVPLCVRPDHIVPGTGKQNTQEAFSRGLNPIGEERSHSKLNDAAVLEIRKMRGEGISCPVIARKFGVKEGTIWNVIVGRCWAHVKAQERER